MHVSSVDILAQSLGYVKKIKLVSFGDLNQCL